MPAPITPRRRIGALSRHLLPLRAMGAQANGDKQAQMQQAQMQAQMEVRRNLNCLQLAVMAAPWARP